MRRRRSFWSPFFAALLILLTASPFTAPFQTFDLSAPTGEAQGHDGLSCEKTSKECAASTLTIETVLRFHSVAFSSSAPHLIVQHPLDPHTVLRL